MLKLVVFLSFLALCAAQVRPVFPDTFVGEYETEITYIGKYGDVKLTGTGRRAYNQAENKGVHMATVRSEGENPAFEYHYFLALFDIGLEFHYNKDTEQPFARCEKEQVFGDMSPYFDWVKNARYGGRNTIGEEGYDFWEIEIGADKHEIAVTPTDPNRPVYYMHHHEYENRTVYDKYTYFEAILPDSNDFEIPSYCQEIAPTRKQAGVASRNL